MNLERTVLTTVFVALMVLVLWSSYHHHDAHAAQQAIAPKPVLLYALVNGVPVAVTSASTANPINYTPEAVLAKCLNGTNVVDCAFGVGSTTFATPASSSAPCTVPQTEYDGSFIYECVAANTWRRVALNSF